MSILPRLFIGSSVEGLEVAYAIQENLEFEADATVWRQGVFRPTNRALSDLVEIAPKFDFASFVFTPDDTAQIRGERHAVVRDNVIFELGLFFGAIGTSRCFYVAPRDAGPLHLPTDLLGVAPLTYRSERSDGNLIAALGSACNQMRRAFRENWTAKQGTPPTIEHYKAIWDSPKLVHARASIREIPLDHYSPEWQAARDQFKQVFAFLETLSAAVLSNSVDEAAARSIFGAAVLSFWPVAATMLAPPNHRDEWWDPPPQLALLHGKWAQLKNGNKP